MAQRSLLEFESFSGRVIGECLLILLVLLLVILYYPHNKLLASFALGLAVSIINTLLLSFRMKRMFFLLPYGTDRAQLFAQLGLVSRLSLVFTLLYFITKTGWFSLTAVMAGLLFVPLFGMVLAVKILVVNRG